MPDEAPVTQTLRSLKLFTGSLFRAGDSYGSPIEKLHKLAESRDLEPLVIAVDAPMILGVHHGSNIVGLDAPGSQFGRIRGADLHDGNGDHSRKHCLLRVLQCMKRLSIEPGRWRGWALIGVLSVYDGYGRIVEQLGQTGFESLHVLVRKRAHVKPRL